MIQIEIVKDSVFETVYANGIVVGEVYKSNKDWHISVRRSGAKMWQQSFGRRVNTRRDGIAQITARAEAVVAFHAEAVA